MIVTLTLIILGAAIVLFFSQEFIGLFKRVFAIPGAPLVLPLFVASLAVLTFSDEFLIVVYYTRLIVSQLLITLTSLMPFQQAARSVVLVLFLTFASVVPVLVLHLIWQRKSYYGYPFPYTTSAFIWAVLALFLLIPSV